MGEKEEKERRKPWRVFIQPKLQIKVGGYYLFIAVASLLMLNLTALYFFFEVVRLGHTADPTADVFSLMTAAAISSKWVFVLAAFVLLISFLLLSFWLSHRVAGPAYALSKHIKELKEGNFDHRTHLRERDELKGLMRDLNELSEALKSRQSEKASAAQ